MYVCTFVCACACIYACMYVCTRIYVCTFMYVCMSVCIYVCVHLCVYVYRYIYIYANTRTYIFQVCMHVIMPLHVRVCVREECVSIFKHACICVCIYVCVYACACVCVNVYVRICACASPIRLVIFLSHSEVFCFSRPLFFVPPKKSCIHTKNSFLVCVDFCVYLAQLLHGAKSLPGEPSIWWESNQYSFSKSLCTLDRQLNSTKGRTHAVRSLAVTCA